MCVYTRGEVAAGPRGKPTTERRKLERLREVAKGQAVLCKLRFQCRPGRTRLNASRHRALLDVENAIESPEVEAHHRTVAIVDVAFDAADDAGPATKRDDRDLRVARPVEQGADVLFGPRRRNEIGRGIEVASKTTKNVAVGPAVGVPDPSFVIVAEYAVEPGRHAHARRAQRDRVE